MGEKRTGRSVGRPAPHSTDSLLPVAVGVFIERGYDGTSMEDLARAMGIGKSSIYHHVAGKETLLRLAVERAIDRLFAVLDEPGASSGPAVDRLRYVIGRTTEVLLGELPYVTLLLRVRGNTETERWALERRREFDRRVTVLLREAAEDGAVRDDIEPRLATRLLFGMINSLVEWRHHPGSADAEIVRAVVALASRGVETERQPQPDSSPRARPAAKTARRAAS
jgi:AcrR family transcriptional regulator